jgi:uncharacterized membrane protein
MNTLGKLFLKGLAVVIPVTLTMAIMWWMAAGAERLMGSILKFALPEGWYVPGMGLTSGLALIYTAIKDFIGYLNPDKDSKMSKVVMVQLPGQSFQLIGFVTREQFDDLPFTPSAEDPVAVYMPMSYQIGGYTLFLPRNALTPLDIPFEAAMRLVLTAGVSQTRENGESEKKSES